MDLKKFAKFINYKPIFAIEEIENEVKKIQKRASVYLNDEKIKGIWKAYEYAKNAHEGVVRQSGEPYISHTVLTTKILMDINPGLPAIQAALLHDVIEDTPLTEKDIENNFGSEVAFLCTGLEKVAKVKYSGEDRHLETLKKTFLAMGQDLRVIFIKIADRIHNIQTLHYHPQKNKQIKIAEETLKIYVPIAQRLGFGIFQGFLEDGSFRIINPGEFDRIYSFIKKRFKGIDKDIEEIDKKLKKIADEQNIPYYSIRGRVKGLYRIYLKLHKYETHDISDIKDIVAFRFVTDSVKNCYAILGNIHKYYTPVIKKIKDYIAVPKSNGYQSIHTTVLGLYKHPIEIQIRTKGMDEIARYGVAAHFFYKEKGKSEILDTKQSAWIKKLQNMVKMYQNAGDNEEFKKMLNIDFLRKNIFVYTPNGDIIELPKGATVLDFAFRIHTDIGLKFKIATVNGNVSPISKILKTGDIVEVKNYRNKYTANKGRLRFLVSPSSKEKVNKFLKSVDKKIYIEIGKETLNIQLEKLELPKYGTPDDKIKKSFNIEEIEKILIQISNKNYSPRKLINKIYPEMKPSPEKKDSNHTFIDNLSQEDSEVIIDDTTLFEYNFCGECIPSEKDQIIGKIGRNNIKIHTTGCKALKKIKFSKLVEAHWAGQEKMPYAISFDFEIKDKAGMLIKILNIFKELDINIIGLRTGEIVHNEVHITGEFNNPTTVDFIIKDLKKLAIITTKIIVSIESKEINN